MRTYKVLKDLLKKKKYYSDVNMTIEEIKIYLRGTDGQAMKNFKKNFSWEGDKCINSAITQEKI